MPELPDLTIVAEELRPCGRPGDRRSDRAHARSSFGPRRPTGRAGRHARWGARRRGKFLCCRARWRPGRPGSGRQPMLAGRFWFLTGRHGQGARTHRAAPAIHRWRRAPLRRSRDARQALPGSPRRPGHIPGWSEMGPDADDPELTLDRSANASAGIRASSSRSCATRGSWPASATPTATRSCGRPACAAPPPKHSRRGRVDRLYPPCARSWRMLSPSCASSSRRHPGPAPRTAEGSPPRRRALPALRKATSSDRWERGDHVLPDLPAPHLSGARLGDGENPPDLDEVLVRDAIRLLEGGHGRTEPISDGAQGIPFLDHVPPRRRHRRAG